MPKMNENDWDELRRERALERVRLEQERAAARDRAARKELDRLVSLRKARQHPVRNFFLGCLIIVLVYAIPGAILYWAGVVGR
jgi:hypothetical protein